VVAPRELIKKIKIKKAKKRHFRKQAEGSIDFVEAQCMWVR
jgi:hypothetical protein